MDTTENKKKTPKSKKTVIDTDKVVDTSSVVIDLSLDSKTKLSEPVVEKKKKKSNV